MSPFLLAGPAHSAKTAREQMAASQSGGGLYGCDADVIRNNIIWANTGGQIVESTSHDYCCVDEEENSGGAHNIGPFSDPSVTDPGFVSDEFVDAWEFLDEFSGSYDDSWYFWGGTWTAEGREYIEKTNAGGGNLVRSNTDPDLELWFRYYRDNNNTGVAHVRFDMGTPQDDRVRIVMSSTRTSLDERVDGAYTTLDNNNDADTLVDTWYDYYVKCSGPDIEVWRGEEGGEMSKILETDEAHKATVLTTTNMPFWQLAGTCRLDDIALVVNNNWHQFLHLHEDSECIDVGDTPLDPETGEPVPFRDFDDHLGPLDGDGVDEEERDIGADEYPTPSREGFTFWWENFRIVLEE